MNENKFVAGPWIYDPNDREDLQIRDSNRNLVAEVFDNRSFTLTQCQYNAKLIATSPELLACLIDCVENILIDFPDDDPRKLKYKSIIEKATK